MTFEHSSKNRNILILIALAVLLLGITFAVSPNFTSQPTDESAAVRTVVEGFGQRLKNVSLLSPTAGQELEENYRDFVVPELLEAWKNNPAQAPGRLTSSPWPDRIEISDIQMIEPDIYAVQGAIVEVTSTESPSGTSTSRFVTMTVRNIDAKWRISGLSIGN